MGPQDRPLKVKADFLPPNARNEEKPIGLFKKILELAAKWCRQIGGVRRQLFDMTGLDPKNPPGGGKKRPEKGIKGGGVEMRSDWKSGD